MLWKKRLCPELCCAVVSLAGDMVRQSPATDFKRPTRKTSPAEHECFTILTHDGCRHSELNAKKAKKIFDIPSTPFQNWTNEVKKGAQKKFVHFWKALTILMLKKYLKSWFIDTILHVFFKKPNFFSKIFFGLKSSRRSKN